MLAAPLAITAQSVIPVTVQAAGSQVVISKDIDPAKPLSLETSLPGISWKTATGRLLTSAKVSDYNTFDQPETVRLAAFAGAKKRGNQLSISLPPHSVVVLELR